MNKQDTNGILYDYFSWLVAISGGEKFGDRIRQLEVMFDVPFEAHISGDENRLWYGGNLKTMWWDDFGQYKYGYRDMAIFEAHPISVFEVLRALADGVYENCDDRSIYSPIGWFWEMLKNMGIRPRTTVKECKRICEAFVNRDREDASGVSPFPVKDRTANYKYFSTLELWYVMMRFLEEN